MNYLVIEGDCIEQLKNLKDNSVDSVVTDPPYELGFMGKGWDSAGVAFNTAIWAECLRVLKPGGHLLSFGGARTYHRIACAIEDAGFEVRDCIQWVYATGFPKSLDVAKAIDARHFTGGRSDSTAIKKANAERPGEATVRERSLNGHNGFVGGTDIGPSVKRAEPATDAARQWLGWGTALKPAYEPVIVARKPLDGTVAENVLKWGTGALNINGTRIGTTKDVPASPSQSIGHVLSGAVDGSLRKLTGNEDCFNPNIGRWPSNFIMDEEAAKQMDEFVGPKRAGYTAPHHKKGARTGDFLQMQQLESGGFKAESFDRTLGPSRYFYVAKPSKRERDAGLGDDFPPRSGGEATDREDESAGLDSPRAGAGRTGGLRNFHVTVKPVMLMRYLIRLVTPTHGVVVDPFTGSGTTGIAAMLEGCQFIGVEQDSEYVRLAKARIATWEEHK